MHFLCKRLLAWARGGEIVGRAHGPMLNNAHLQHRFCASLSSPWGPSIWRKEASGWKQFGVVFFFFQTGIPLQEMVVLLSVSLRTLKKTHPHVPAKFDTWFKARLVDIRRAARLLTAQAAE